MKTITLNSKVKDIMKTPVGHDIISKILLQMGRDVSLVNNPVIGNMSLKTLKRLTKKMLSDGFWDTFITLMNSDKEEPASDRCGIKPAWWKEAVFYQIYPRSFCDSNGDGIGDIPGMTERLDYLKELGVNVLWLSPIYDSPLDDNGYDIRDYKKILAAFGTMEDFDRLLAEAHERGMRLIMDLVVNHTSDEHPWFQSAINDPDSPYRDYYFFREGTHDKCPNNWTSFFSGPAWNYYDQIGQWGLHLFSKKQMDLNWDNPALRNDVCDMIRWWLEKGVDGFRMDVINYISKAPGLPDGDETIGSMMGFCGVEHYFYGPRLHEYLKQIRREAFDPYNAFSVGETPGVGMEMAKLITGDDRHELDMIFSFDQLENPGKVRFDDYEYDLNYMKKYFMDWTLNYGDHCWQSLFFENHDNPRMVSKVSRDPAYHEAIAKLVLTVQLTLPGSPFIYQGQEWNTANHPFKDISEIDDVESRNLYKDLCEKESPEEAWKTILAGTRDHARILLDWSEADRQKKNSRSTYNFVRELIKFRRNNTDTLIYGDIEFIDAKRKDYFAYERRSKDLTVFVEMNLSKGEIKRSKRTGDMKALMCNYDSYGERLRPYEVIIWTE